MLSTTSFSQRRRNIDNLPSIVIEKYKELSDQENCAFHSATGLSAIYNLEDGVTAYRNSVQLFHFIE